MNVSIHTLGCKVNQYESQAMALLLRERGHTLSENSEGTADAYIINSCTVTATSDKKSRQLLRQLRRANPEAIIALCGCYPQVSTEEAQKLGADLLGGSGEREAFVDALEAVWRERSPRVSVDAAAERSRFEFLPGGGLGDRTRAMLKVEDGCQNFCTYCVIPRARGPVRSLPPEHAVSEARRLAGEGYRELVLTGIELSSWGRDFAQEGDLAALIEAICLAVPPEIRIRLGSLEPRTVTEDFCRRLAGLPNLCAHFHLSLQSGCDATLRRMGRRYNAERYAESVALLRRHFDHPGITTDLIVGFPGETAAEFAETLSFLERCAFSAMHIFPYSRRADTPAAKMPNQLSNHEKAERAKAAQNLAAQMEAAYLESLVGREISVLFEEEKDGLWQGHSPQYALVRAAGENLRNEIKTVRVTRALGDHVIGTIIEEAHT